MASRFDVTLNGVSLLQAVPGIIVVDIEYNPAEIEDVSMEKGKGHGLIITKRRFKGSSVIVRYDLSIYDPEARHSAILAVQQWAMNGGILRTSDRDGQRLMVRCSKPPSVGSALRWTTLLEIQFQADENPFWENETEDTVTVAQSGIMNLSGIVDDVPVSATITSESTITDITVSCGQTSITLTGISVSTGTSITVNYDSNGFLQIRAGDTDLMSYRTGSDELLASAGQNVIEVDANTTVSCVLRARGRWL